MPVIYPDSEALGILVCERLSNSAAPGNPPFAEGGFVRRLILAGNLAGMRLFAFDPRHWRPGADTVAGWTPDPRGPGWHASAFPLPAALYDRSWPERGEERARYRHALHEFESAVKPVRLSGNLPDKRKVDSVLSKNAEIARLLPPTLPFDGTESFLAALERFGGSAFLKPASGSQGRRTAACAWNADGSLRIRGRRTDNRPFDLILPDAREAAARICRWIGNRPYLMQPYLDLTDADGKPFDIRVLLQKNGRGRWAWTGAAARTGPSGTVTANLHGGGRAERAEDVLSALFGPARSAGLIREIRNACKPIVRCLEAFFGRFCELGLDFGLERSGRLWFLEANSKPGRSAMAALGSAVAEAAASRPIAYAKSILLRSPGRVIHEFDHL